MRSEHCSSSTPLNKYPIVLFIDAVDELLRENYKI